ncbi:MAG: hypothetical protein L6Q98_19885 [Anaerolineae bacterium]|nr:hypothetical protein [Anaerolineae bacterium]NUQ06720.1 hypothetical protein [Anaerolineae bacterium]
MAITLAEINTAIAASLGAATGIARVQDAAKPDPDEGLTEGIADLPMLQVYWQSLDTSTGSENDRIAMRGGVRVTQCVFHADVYARQRGMISEDAARTLELAEAVQEILEAQDVKPYFGLIGVKSFRWTAERVTFDYAGVAYAGVRFVITVWVF